MSITGVGSSYDAVSFLRQLEKYTKEQTTKMLVSDRPKVQDRVIKMLGIKFEPYIPHPLTENRVLSITLGLLNKRELAAASCVSRKWKQIANNPVLWRNLVVCDRDIHFRDQELYLERDRYDLAKTRYQLQHISDTLDEIEHDQEETRKNIYKASERIGFAISFYLLFKMPYNNIPTPDI